MTPQGLLSFEMSEEGVEDNSLTEAAMDDFEEGSLSNESAEDDRQKFSQQVQIYSQNKPRKKKNTDREFSICINFSSPSIDVCCHAGPPRKTMMEYKRQSAGQVTSPDPQPIAPPFSSPMGMMQMPGRGVIGNYPLDLVTSDSTYEATVLGELAVISIESPEVRGLDCSFIVLITSFSPRNSLILELKILLSGTINILYKGT